MSNSPYSFATLRNRLRITATLVAETALRIGAGRASDPTRNDLPVVRDLLGQPFVPGASLKGVLRAQLETLLQALATKSWADAKAKLDEIKAALPHVAAGQYLQTILNSAVDRTILDLPQLEARTSVLRQIKALGLNEATFTALVWHQASMIDLTFGSPEIAGRLFVKDARVVTELWSGRFEVRNGVGINRDTETAEPNFLYDYEVVPADTRFEVELVLENSQPWQRGMLLYALLPWQRGEVAIGGFRSRGLGHVRLDDPQFSFTEVQSVDDVIALLDGTTQAPDEATQTGWRQAFVQELRKGVEADHA